MSSIGELHALKQLQEKQSTLLDKIDELRTIGVGGLVELPQLIVCGDQSSGKSSVLEAISRVQFPVKGNACTRFATELILRRNPSSRIKISIEPGISRTDEQDRERLSEFTHDEVSVSGLPVLIEKAREHMGVDESVNSGFSDDVLKVEISRPDNPELTLVDLPGLYSGISPDQGWQGKQIVHDLTRRYMKNSRSIILAVISAKSEYHVQPVLNIAEEYDPKRERTFGIVTQPDTLDANSEQEETYLHFILNQKIRLQLGWHVLCNRSFETRHYSSEERDERERTFFSQGRWASLSRERTGVESLRHRLSNILLKLIHRNLPELIADMHEKISDREQKLSKLGIARSTIQQQRGFLLDISSNFERILGQALNGMYEDEFFGGFKDATDMRDFRRLRAVIRYLNECFVEAMDAKGCQRRIVTYGNGPSDVKGFTTTLEHPYLDGWLPPPITRSTLQQEVTKQARRNRGIELPGSANQLLVGSLFRNQSQPWEGLAKNHLIKAWESGRYFVFLVLRHLTDEHTSSSLAASMLEPELEKLRQGLLEKLSELTAHLKRGHPLPIGKSFLSQIQKAKNERLLKSLRERLPLKDIIQRDEGATFDIQDIEKATGELNLSSDEFAADEIINQMQAYYDIAIITFIDNVAILGIENCLLEPLQRIFTCQVVNYMEDDQIQRIASEPRSSTEERERLNRELETLQAGLKTLNFFNAQNLSLRSPPVFTPSNRPPFTRREDSYSTQPRNVSNWETRKFAKPTFASPKWFRANLSDPQSSKGLFGDIASSNNTKNEPTSIDDFLNSSKRSPTDLKATDSSISNASFGLNNTESSFNSPLS